MNGNGLSTRAATLAAMTLPHPSPIKGADLNPRTANHRAALLTAVRGSLVIPLHATVSGPARYAVTVDGNWVENGTATGWPTVLCI